MPEVVINQVSSRPLNPPVSFESYQISLVHMTFVSLTIVS